MTFCARSTTTTLGVWCRDWPGKRGSASGRGRMPPLRSGDAFDLRHLATGEPQGLVVLADGLLVGPFQQAVHLALGVVVELDLPYAELVGLHVPGVLSNLRDGLVWTPQVLVDIHEPWHVNSFPTSRATRVRARLGLDTPLRTRDTQPAGLLAYLPEQRCPEAHLGGDHHRWVPADHLGGHVPRVFPGRRRTSADELGALDVPRTREDNRAGLVEDKRVLVEHGERMERMSAVGEPVFVDQVLPVQVLFFVGFQFRRVVTQPVE